MNQKILLVDDEQHVLSGYRRNLMSHFEVHTAAGGKLGCEAIKKSGPFSVVISDFNMPEMNGNQFLSFVRETAPDTVRMMLTGYADLETTIDAVNEGNIFRLLTKPCSSEKLISSIKDGIKQYELITSEKVLLDKTLKGVVMVLVDILSAVNQPAFSRVSRFRKFIPAMSELLNIKNKWEVEVAILLSQIGLVIMPADLLEVKYAGGVLTDEQEKLFLSHPFVGKSLISGIPRLENIAEIIYYQFHSYSKPAVQNENSKYGDSLPIVSRILKVLNDFDTLITFGHSTEDAFEKLSRNEKDYDPDVVIALDAAISGIYENLKLASIEIMNLEPGVVVAANIKDKNGQVLITKGAEITEMLKMKLINLYKLGQIESKVKIFQ